MVRCLTVPAFFITFPGLHAQEPYAFYKNFGTDQGLPSERVRTITQDLNGYIWVGTNAGLARFDGNRFETFQNQEHISSSLSSDNIVKLEASGSRHLWVGHYEAGVDLFDTETAEVVTRINEGLLPDSRVTEIWEESDRKRVWIGSFRSMWVWYDLQKKELTRPSPSTHPLSHLPVPDVNSVYDILRDPEIPYQYWLATNAGLALFNENDNTLRYFYFNEGRSGLNTDDRLRSLLWKDGSLYIAVRGPSGLLCFDPRALRLRPRQPELPPKTLLVDIAGKDFRQIWLGSTNHSLGIYDSNTHFFHNDPALRFSILPGAVADLHKDHAGNLWIATVKGLSFWSMENQHFRFTSLEKYLSDSNKLLTFSDDGENLFLGFSSTQGLPVYSMKQKKLSFVYPSDQPRNTLFSIQRFAKDPEGTLWMVASGKLFRYHQHQLQKINLPGDIGNELHSILFDQAGNLYLGTRFSGLYRWNRSSQRLDQLSMKKGGLVHDRFLHEMLFDRKGNLWIGTERGISIIDTASFSVKRNIAEEYNLKVIYRMASDHNGNIWATTENQGVMAFDPVSFRRVKHLTKEDGLPSNAVQHLMADNTNNIWIATQQGLCRYHQPSAELDIFTRNNGLAENQLEGSLNLLSDGRAVQGYDIGFAIFDPASIRSDTVPQKPRITSFTLFGKNRHVTENIRLHADENFFNIRFSSIDFSKAHLIQYAYRLKGLNEDWVYTTSQNEVNFSKVRFGDYLFEVKAAFAGSTRWSEVTRMHITIVPPFYFSWWFLSIALIGVWALFYYLYRRKIERITREERKAAEINQQVFTSELRALRNQMNPHFLYNCINSIKYFVITHDIGQASAYLNKFAKLMRKILNNSHHEFISLEEEIETLSLYLEMERMRFSEKMTFSIYTDPEITLSRVRVPTMLIQPFLENAIWHGLMQKQSNDGRIELLVEKYSEEGKMLISIRDNGIGRRAAAEIKSKSAEKNKSMGIEMTQARIRHLNEVNHTDIHARTYDLENPDGTAAGTLVQITLKILPLT